jgi:hypothetical protein
VVPPPLLKAVLAALSEREVLLHVPDAWGDHDKTKIGLGKCFKTNLIGMKIN